jgi:hypothetical protein
MAAFEPATENWYNKYEIGNKIGDFAPGCIYCIGMKQTGAAVCTYDIISLAAWD